jgi:hypothetical protein
MRKCYHFQRKQNLSFIYLLDNASTASGATDTPTGFNDVCTPRVRSVNETPATFSWCQKHRKSQRCMHSKSQGCQWDTNNIQLVSKTSQKSAMYALQKSGVSMRHQQHSAGVKSIAKVSDVCTPSVRSVNETLRTFSWCQKHRKSQRCMHSKSQECQWDTSNIQLVSKASQEPAMYAVQESWVSMRHQQQVDVKNMVSSVLRTQKFMWAIRKRLHGKGERCSKWGFPKNMLSCFSCMWIWMGQMLILIIIWYIFYKNKQQWVPIR